MIHIYLFTGGEIRMKKISTYSPLNALSAIEARRSEIIYFFILKELKSITQYLLITDRIAKCIKYEKNIF